MEMALLTNTCGYTSACVIFKLSYLTLTSNTPKTDTIYLCLLFLSVVVVVVFFCSLLFSCLFIQVAVLDTN